ncbi:iron-containing alcohol dehydrogenase [Anaerobaca lacustris]|uniref:Iron-containing alcohol dehydrogenase n=1 Tax=Anaerobaca lacustris TaxID=3044600 RepID=A0AAW6TZA4_9BACT|nr:iron-containing alcohol dehydrogenase [Sedimentisphaerales bacterium M17dextr]
MGLSELLGTKFRCDCGRSHDLTVRRFVYDAAAIDRLPDIVRQCAGHCVRAVVVADSRTWEVCGRRVLAALKRTYEDAYEIVVADGEHGTPVCDEATFQTLLARLREAKPEVMVAVGSGVVNDLCKWASFEMGIPYLVVATAASMNGYPAANVAATIAGVKVLLEARPPLAVIAEPQTIAGAPHEMIEAGFGDTIAKHQSNTDWWMNHRLFGEYHCNFCAGIVADLEPLYLDRPEEIKEGDVSAVEGLFAALFWSGVAMTLVGTSAPASGGEHLLSHTLDMIASVRGHRHDLHGRQVGVGTILSAALYEKILAIESPEFCTMPAQVDAGFWSDVAVAEAVARQYEAKRAGLDAVRRHLAERNTWDRLRAELAERSRRPQEIRGWLERAGGATCAAHIGCSTQQLRDAALHMHEIRKRFTVVDLAWMMGVLPDALDDIIAQWLSD